MPAQGAKRPLSQKRRINIVSWNCSLLWLPSSLIWELGGLLLPLGKAVCRERALAEAMDQVPHEREHVFLQREHIFINPQGGL